MSNPIRQHWVPRFYLEYFSIPNQPDRKQVYIFHRSRDEDFQIVSVDKIAVKKHLYSPPKKDGSRDFSTETNLAGLEGLLAQRWPELANGFVDLGESSLRKAIALFLATIYLRHPDTFRQQQQSMKDLRDLIADAPTDTRGLPDIDQVMIGKTVVSFDRASWAEGRDWSDLDSHRGFVDHIRSEAMEFAEQLMDKRWSIIIIDEPLFVTSDNPFFVVDPDLKRWQFRGPNAKCMFPLSPTRVLQMDDFDAPPNLYHSVPSSEAALYNTFTWINTDDYMISPRNTDEVLTEILDYKDRCESDG